MPVNANEVVLGPCFRRRYRLDVTLFGNAPQLRLQPPDLSGGDPLGLQRAELLHLLVHAVQGNARSLHYIGQLCRTEKSNQSFLWLSLDPAFSSFTN